MKLYIRSYNRYGKRKSCRQSEKKKSYVRYIRKKISLTVTTIVESHSYIFNIAYKIFVSAIKKQMESYAEKALENTKQIFNRINQQ